MGNELTERRSLIETSQLPIPIAEVTFGKISEATAKFLVKPGTLCLVRLVLDDVRALADLKEEKAIGLTALNLTTRELLQAPANLRPAKSGQLKLSSGSVVGISGVGSDWRSVLNKWLPEDAGMSFLHHLDTYVPGVELRISRGTVFGIEQMTELEKLLASRINELNSEGRLRSWGWLMKDGLTALKNPKFKLASSKTNPTT